MTLFEDFLRCVEHQCPMLRIDDAYECVVERIDDHLGGRQVKDVIPAGKGAPVALVFDDGHTIPLLCPDCGGSVHMEDADSFLDSVAGLYLVGVSAYVEEVEDGVEREALALGFAPEPDGPEEPDVWEDSLDWLPIHVESARRITCPAIR